MSELFPDHPIYEYPQLVNIVYSFLWAFVLSSIIAITHRLTHSGEHYPKNFFQSLVLGAIVTTMIMMAIGDSLARGLGVFGAMAIIRFRTRVDDPRDVLFLFAALSTGLAIGVYGMTISFVGTLLFCFVAGVLHFSPFRNVVHTNHLFFSLKNAELLERVLAVVEKHCSDKRMISLAVNKENILRYQYSISLRKNASKDQLLKDLQSVEGISQVKIAAVETPTVA